MINNYLKKAALYRQFIQPTELQKVVERQWQKIEELQDRVKQQQEFDKEQLYVYQTPKFVGNSCSLEYGTEPYDLVKVLKNKAASNTRYLALLNDIVQMVYQSTKVGWIGIYKKMPLQEGDALVKMAYRGLESRAEFPLYIPDFKSNNKEVGLTGQAIVLNDIDAYLSKGGAYYECDVKVQAEVCLPIFDTTGSEIIGIVDAEDHQKYFFNTEKTMEIIALCINLSRVL